ncbi:MAG: conjugal transfer protein TraC [Sulfobacillus benefaciens]|uniref:Conjugal transfer protein TraC n=1 Tax=Sulfobacillus benefaciens TaxID=453960 RepID=A0A2T2XFD3_9FIRM|nr:MAG: conjugal transfer protein TraC [Sulfobacillus benefaciens]
MGLISRIRSRKVIPTVSAIMPDAIQFGADKWQMHGKWYRSFLVVAYPREVQAGWFEPFLRFPRPLILTIFSGPVPIDLQLGSMNRSLLWNLGEEEANRRSGRLADPVRHTAIEDAERIRGRVARGETRLIETHLTATLWAESLEELDDASNLLIGLASGMLLVMRLLRYQQEVGLQRILPVFGSPSHPREMDAHAWATLFPYASQEIVHEHGQIWGANAQTHSLVIIDRFQLPSPHSVTVAWSGAGKSFAAKLEILRTRYRGIPVKVLDPEGEYRVLEHIGAHIWKIGDPDNPEFPWDPFRIESNDTPEETERQVDFLLRFVERLDPSIKQMTPILERALWRIIRRFQPSTARGGETTLVFRQRSEIVCDDNILLQELQEIDFATSERVEALIHRWKVLAPVGAKSGFGCQVFDLSRLTEKMKAAAYLAVTEYIARTVIEVPRQLVVFDEAWQLLNDPNTAPYLESLYRRARKWGTALALLTQDIGDFTRNKAAEVCLRNSPIVLLLRQHPESLAEVTQLMRLEAGEVELLNFAQRGQGILIVGDDHVPLNVLAAPYEVRLINMETAR